MFVSTTSLKDVWEFLEFFELLETVDFLVLPPDTDEEDNKLFVFKVFKSYLDLFL